MMFDLLLEADDEEEKKEEEKKEDKEDKEKEEEDKKDSDKDDDDDESDDDTDYNDMFGDDEDIDEAEATEPDSTTDSGTEEEPVSDEEPSDYNDMVAVSVTVTDDEGRVGKGSLFDKIANLGYAFTVISANLHHIHLHAAGPRFDRIHSMAEGLYEYFDKNIDYICELALQGSGIVLDNVANSTQHVQDIPVLVDKQFNFDTACNAINDNLSAAIRYVEAVRAAAEMRSDISSDMDEMLAYLNKQLNYLMRRRTLSTESVEEAFNMLF